MEIKKLWIKLNLVTLILLVISTVYIYIKFNVTHVKLHHSTNHISKIMINPDFFVDKKVTILGYLVKKESNVMYIVSDRNFVNLPPFLLQAEGIYLSQDIYNDNIQMLDSCINKLVRVDGTIKKIGYFYKVIPTLIDNLENNNSCYTNIKNLRK